MDYEDDIFLDPSLDDDELYHQGVGHEDGGHSGRYPWGSGDTPYQRNKDFMAYRAEWKAKGLSDTDIVREIRNWQTAHGLTPNFSTTEYRAFISMSGAQQRAEEQRHVTKLREHGYSIEKISQMTGLTETTVRNRLDESLQQKNDLAMSTANVLRDNVKAKKFIDIGPGVELEMNITSTKLKTAVEILKQEGYEKYNIRIDKPTDPKSIKKVDITVLCPPGTTYNEAYANRYDIQSINEYSVDNGKTYYGIYEPKSIDSKRIKVMYAEDGGAAKDGVIELRRGVNDISLGGAQYAQVRIAVDGTHYMKGMAMYRDDMPDGVDVIYNSNKHIGADKDEVFKKLKKDKKTGEVDKNNPFGAAIKQTSNEYDDYDGFFEDNVKIGGQRFYPDKKGDFIINKQGMMVKAPDGDKSKERYSLSTINILKEEGDWDKCSRTLSSQMLSKQSKQLIKQQLDLTYKEAAARLDEINDIQNTTVRKKMLEDFADSCDKNAVTLKAAPLPRQAMQVILPLTDIKTTEVYAPNYKNGESVALIRYPHQSISEIPILTVNNNNKNGKSVIGPNVKDCVGINATVAERLSGADFDGDTVMVIPLSSKVKIKNMDQLPQLKGFDTKSYKFTKEELAASPIRDDDGKPAIVLKESAKNALMGQVSNLLTDMTLQGAHPDEIARALKHSMVVIDACKHELDYKRSEKENNIRELKNKYQSGGASTIISKSKSQYRVDEREAGVFLEDPETGKKKRYLYDPNTGEKLYTYTGRTYTEKKTGNIKKAQIVSTRMAETKDARELSSGTIQEEYYANFANSMKALANQARKISMATPSSKRNVSAAEQYAAEVASLKAKLNVALKNAPRERQANLIANSIIDAEKKANPNMSKDDISKIATQSLSQARASVGASGKLTRVNITPKEWAAIEANAISSNILSKILMKCDTKQLVKYATPREERGLSTAQIARIKAYKASGYTNDEIADQLNVSVSTIRNYIS